MADRPPAQLPRDREREDQAPGDSSPRCNRCGFPVTVRPWGCKNPCPNCGTVYPLGDCSD